MYYLRFFMFIKDRVPDNSNGCNDGYIIDKRFDVACGRLSGKYVYLWKYLLFGCIILGVAVNGIMRNTWFGSNYAASL